MKQKIPKKLLNSNQKEMWKNSEKILKKLEKIIPISSIYLLGSFTTNKRRLADVDFNIFVKTKSDPKSKWSVDLVIAPDNKFGEEIRKDTEKWMKQKYGAKKSAVIKLK